MIANISQKECPNELEDVLIDAVYTIGRHAEF
jgi:hypothetical protein